MRLKKFLRHALGLSLVLVSTLTFAAASTNAGDDAAITTKVKAAFIKEKLFGDKPIAPMTIHVKTTKGIVYLTGTVASKDQETNAENIAKSVDGVQGVQSNLKIKAVTTAH